MSSPAAKTRDSRAAKFNRRKLVNKLMLSLSMAAMAFGVFWLLWILMDTVRLGIGIFCILLAVFLLAKADGTVKEESKSEA